MVNRCRKGMVYTAVDDSGNVIGIKPGSDTFGMVRNRINVIFAR